MAVFNIQNSRTVNLHNLTNIPSLLKLCKTILFLFFTSFFSLLLKQNTIKSINDGQFYIHTRAVNSINSFKYFIKIRNETIIVMKTTIIFENNNYNNNKQWFLPFFFTQFQDYFVTFLDFQYSPISDTQNQYKNMVLEQVFNNGEIAFLIQILTEYSKLLAESGNTKRTRNCRLRMSTCQNRSFL